MIDQMEPDETLHVLHKGAVLPDELTLVHYHDTSYCIEPRIPIPLELYNKRLFELDSTLRVVNNVQYYEQGVNVTARNIKPRV